MSSHTSDMPSAVQNPSLLRDEAAIEHRVLQVHLRIQWAGLDADFGAGSEHIASGPITAGATSPEGLERLLIPQQKPRCAFRPQPANRAVNRLHPIQVKRAHDSLHQRHVMAGEEVAQQSAPSLNLNDLSAVSQRSYRPSPQADRPRERSAGTLSTRKCALRTQTAERCDDPLGTISPVMGLPSAVERR
jgi:hypothetical protein